MQTNRADSPLGRSRLPGRACRAAGSVGDYRLGSVPVVFAGTGAGCRILGRASAFERAYSAAIMRLRRFFLHVSPAKTYYAAYFGKRFLMGNQQAIECDYAQPAGMQMYFSRIR